ncbi:phospholipase/carboxylesterase family protein [Treponema primitia ZAS-2]|uniref:Phospholipase/carboxylesterase family protein n=1 Tax=Treponema primitia (strain ATCC BAA-887 / DSM 12427 / ZAS-2) TaxID=545694 RepID=F5YP61_TREPZ|nr:MBL fold metallo-hydrolase [Treponema primitia]AEF86242.1 phospholipase/carboxylesterase family protein [Treponema primitia ZAS-2]
MDKKRIKWQWGQNRAALMLGLMLVVSLWFTATVMAGPAAEKNTYVPGGFKAGSVTEGKNQIPYRYFDPTVDPIAVNRASADGKYPLVLYLHGEKGLGTDNIAQLTESNGATFWVADDLITKNPVYVLAPQCPQGKTWTDDVVYTLVFKALNDLINANASIDTNRLYIVGISLGGNGVWDYILKNPTKFAGALPISAQVDQKYYENNGAAFKAIANMAIWVNHAADDDVVPVNAMTDAVDALKAAGSACIKSENYTPGSIVPPHEAWQKIFTGLTAYNWLFEQSLTRSNGNTTNPSLGYTIKKTIGGVTEILDYELGKIHVVEDAEKVVIIDTGMGAGNLYEFIRDNVLINKTLPISIFITHRHGDHISRLDNFVGQDQLKAVYVHETEEDSYPSRLGPDIGKLQTIKDGFSIPLGGDKLEAFEVIGHTPGSLVYFYKNIIFSGDAIGSGDAWMQIGMCSIVDYQKNVQKLLDRIGNNSYFILPGHYEYRKQFNQLYAQNMLTCVNGVIKGTITPGIYQRNNSAIATYMNGGQNANLIYFTEKVFNF